MTSVMVSPRLLRLANKLSILLLLLFRKERRPGNKPILNPTTNTSNTGDLLLMPSMISMPKTDGVKLAMSETRLEIWVL